MKVEIWSDVICPFCYIGKRKFEQAFEQFAGKDDVEIVWKSFQIMPDLQTDPERSVDDVLVDKKRISLEQAKELNGYATQMAKTVGLDYDFDKAIPANTLRAHQFQHLAKSKGKGNEAEEMMFQSYFTDGKNIDDISTLVEIGKKIGLTQEEVKNAFSEKKYADAVQEDIAEAHKIGVTGVPFFVFDRTYGVSWAQDPSVFLQTLEKSHEERKAKQPVSKLEVISGESCDIDGNCQ